MNPYYVASSGRFEDVAGTSASCPVVAGVWPKIKLHLKTKLFSRVSSFFWGGGSYMSFVSRKVNPYCVASSGRFEDVAGTSASCPVVAGVFPKKKLHVKKKFFFLVFFVFFFLVFHIFLLFH